MEANTELSNEQIAEIEARCRAATEGPWDWTIFRDAPDDVIALTSPSGDVLLCTGDSDQSWGEISDEDAKFIEHAREDIPALCHTVKALREKYVRLVEVSEEWARLLDRIRAWSKCDDGYPLDEHINNITINYGRLQSRLAEVERELKVTKQPTFKMRWCPTCGRDDRIQSFKATHYSRGEICRGEPLEIEYSRVSAGEVVAMVDHEGLAEWLDMLVTALQASQKFDYHEWGQFIMGAENWADKLRTSSLPSEPRDYCAGASCDACTRDDCTCSCHATASPAAKQEHDSCSHWREGDSDNCVWCGDDLGPTTEADVTGPAAPKEEAPPIYRNEEGEDQTACANCGAKIIKTGDHWIHKYGWNKQCISDKIVATPAATTPSPDAAKP